MKSIFLLRPLSLAAAGVSLLLAACSTQAPSPAATPAAARPAAANLAPVAGAADYSKPESWLCRPGRNDACTQPLSVTTIAPDGKRTKGDPVVANANAPIDCFYVYPTVSNDTTPNSDMTAGPEEIGVTFAQFSPLRTQCRQFAPLYRQVTLAALRSRFTGTPMTADAALGYNDVLAAWRHYLANDNKGRGVVLIGHSQGSRVITELVAKEIEGTAVHKQIVSVIPIGAGVTVPKGRDVGGSFKSTPLCRSASQTGCAIAYVSFRANTPPPEKSLFGKASAGNEIACTNPAALAGGAAQPKAWFSKRADVSIATGKGTPKWQALSASVDTPFFALPGLVTTQCVSDANGSYLAMKVNADSRSDDIGGDVVVGGNVIDTWGLHLIDVNLALGDLIDVVGQQGKAYLAKK
jgi:pimeloyl-ACP methyl ester carboxylesterase